MSLHAFPPSPPRRRRPKVASAIAACFLIIIMFGSIFLLYSSSFQGSRKNGSQSTLTRSGGTSTQQFTPSSPNDHSGSPSLSPPSLCSIDPPSLTFTNSPRDPVLKPVTIANCGSPADWSASPLTEDGIKWLVLSPSVGTLTSETPQKVNIVVITSKIKDAQPYRHGTVTFTLGPSQPGTVSISFLNSIQSCFQPSLCPRTQLPNFSFVAVEGHGNQQSQQIAIEKGSSASVSTDDGRRWLSINTSNASIGVDSTDLSAGVYQGTYTTTVGTGHVVLVVQAPTTTASPQPAPSETPTPIPSKTPTSSATSTPALTP